MIVALALALAAAPPGGPAASPELAACLAAAHAERPRQHCLALEITRLSARLPANAWKARTDARCEALARPGTGTLGSVHAQECKIDAYARRLRRV